VKAALEQLRKQLRTPFSGVNSGGNCETTCAIFVGGLRPWSEQLRLQLPPKSAGATALGPLSLGRAGGRRSALGTEFETTWLTPIDGRGSREIGAIIDTATKPPRRAVSPPQPVRGHDHRRKSSSWPHGAHRPSRSSARRWGRR